MLGSYLHLVHVRRLGIMSVQVFSWLVVPSASSLVHLSLVVVLKEVKICFVASGVLDAWDLILWLDM